MPRRYATRPLHAPTAGPKLHSDLATAISQMTRIGQWLEPEPEPAHTYEQLYRRVYCRMYQRLRPLYRDIQAITGYPDNG